MRFKWRWDIESNSIRYMIFFGWSFVEEGNCYIKWEEEEGCMLVYVIVYVVL